MAAPILTQERLTELLQYDEKTGEFIWRVKRGNKAAGTVAGCLDAEGYRVIRVDTRLRRANVLAWLYVHGYYPTLDIDHKNNIKYDNRLMNLREATRSENMQNVTLANANSTSKFRGVRWDGSRNKWLAQIKINYKNIFLGRFSLLEDALKARKQAEKQHHTFKAAA